MFRPFFRLTLHASDGFLTDVMHYLRVLPLPEEIWHSSVIVDPTSPNIMMCSVNTSNSPHTIYIRLRALGIISLALEILKHFWFSFRMYYNPRPLTYVTTDYSYISHLSTVACDNSSGVVRYISSWS